MKRVISIVLMLTVILSSTVVSLAAPAYGSEWNGYYQVAPVTFSDVHSTHWAYDAIMQVYQKDWFKGYPDGTFRPNASITRGEAVKVFVMFLGLDYQNVDLSDIPFYDISASDWNAPFIVAGKDLFPTHTTIQGKRPFNPNMPVTREDTIYALVRALGCHVGVATTDQYILNMFPDQSSISGDLRPYLTIALQHELVSGLPDGTIRAQAALTRAEFATLLLRGTEHGFHDNYEAKIDTVNVTPASIDMSIGEAVKLNARAIYTDGSNKEFSGLQPYVADGMNVVSVSGTTVTALKDGKATVKFNNAELKNKSISVVVNKPTDAPALKITDWFEVTEEATMTIKGTASYKNEAVDLTCNGKDVLVNSDGSFSVTVNLKVGINNIKFVAKNSYDTETTKNITIERKESKTSPVVPSPEPVTPDEDDDDDSFGGITEYEDGEPYLTFDKSTGTITKCGTSASDIEIPEKIDGVNVYNIGEGAFAGCTYLESIEFPSTLKKIGNEAFSGCIRLFEVDIPEGVTSIGANAFEGCVSLTDAIIPEGVKRISDDLFSGCKRLTNVSLPDGITSIGEYAFDGCKSMTEIELPESVTKIANGAFTDCGGLKKIIIPDNVTSIEDDSFDGCNSLTIYASVNSYAIDYAKENSIAWVII